MCLCRGVVSWLVELCVLLLPCLFDCDVMYLLIMCCVCCCVRCCVMWRSRFSVLIVLLCLFACVVLFVLCVCLRLACSLLGG